MYPFNDIQIDQKLYIRELQSYLRRLSLNYPVIPRLNVDGVYGAATGRAVAAFQKRFGLPITRQTDRVTWETVHSEHRRLTDPEPPPHSDLWDTLPLKAGDRSAAVAQLNEWLRLLSGVYGELPEVPESHDFAPSTVNAVSRMQQILLLPVNGIVNYPTWRGIASAASAAEKRIG